MKNIDVFLLLCHSKGCDVNVAQGMLLAKGFHFILNLSGCPLFHIARTPVMFRDLNDKLNNQTLKFVYKHKVNGD